jgi:hypothetical protein
MAVRKLQVVIAGEAKGAVNAAKETETAFSKMGDKLKDIGGKLQGVLAGAGIGGGLALADGLVGSFSREDISKKLAQQVGASGQWAADLGTIAGNVYGAGFGSGLEDAAMGVREVLQNGLLEEDATNAEIESITGKVMALVDVFDQDLNMAAQASGQMIKTGLADNADEALDILTRGMQQGADKAGDLLETFQEYGTQFRQVGLDGAAATGLMVQGMGAGARDADTVADAIKEFTDLSQSGAQTSIDAFTRLGLSAGDMAAAVARGGPEAAAALDLTLDKLRAMPESAERSQLAVALFGEKAIDLGGALYALDPSEATRALGQVGGAAAGNTEALDTNAAKLEGWKRRAEEALAGFVTDNLPKLASLKNWFLDLPGGIQGAAGAMGGLVLVGGGVGMVADKVSSGFSAISSMAKGAASGAQSVAGGVGRLRDGYRSADAAQSAFSGKMGSLGGKLKSFTSGIGSGAKAFATWTRSAGAATIATTRQTIAAGASKLAAYAVAAAQKAWTIAQWALNAAMNANPIGLIVLAIAGLVGGLLWAYHNVDWFRTAVDAAWQGIQTAISFAWNNVIKPIWDAIWGFIENYLIPGIELYASIYKTAWDGMVAALSWAWDKTWGIFTAIGNGIVWVRDTIAGGIESVVGFFTGLPGRIASAAGNLFGFIADNFRGVIQSVIQMWNSLRIPQIGPWEIRTSPWSTFKIGPFGPWDLPDLPTFHTGGKFHAPSPGGEGLALLRDGEIIKPSALATEAASAPPVVVVHNEVTINAEGHVLTEHGLVELVRSGMIRAAQFSPGPYMPGVTG